MAKVFFYDGSSYCYRVADFIAGYVVVRDNLNTGPGRAARLLNKHITEIVVGSACGYNTCNVRYRHISITGGKPIRLSGFFSNSLNIGNRAARVVYRIALKVRTLGYFSIAQRVGCLKVIMYERAFRLRRNDARIYVALG